MSSTSSAAPKSSKRFAERRTSKRDAIVLRVGLLTEKTAASYCLVKNISPTGVQVRLFSRTVAGSDVSLRIGDEEPLAGRVAWVHDGLAGIEFATPLDPVTLLRAAQKLAATKRRSSPRVEATAQVLLRTAGRTYSAVLCDISSSGAKLRTSKSVPLGPTLIVTLPDFPPIRAFVRWAYQNDIGVAFETPLPIHLMADWLGERLRVSG